MLTFVIARDTEDLAWLDRLPADARIYIYQRGPESPTTWRRGDVRRVRMIGGEGIGGAYLQHLSLHHDDDAVGHTVFAPGNALDYAPDLCALAARPEAWGAVQVLSCQGLDFPVSQQRMRNEAGPRVRAESFSLHTWAPLALADETVVARVRRHREAQDLDDAESISVQVLRGWGLEVLGRHAADADLGSFAHGPVLAVQNSRIALIRRALATQHEAAMARLLRAARTDAPFFDLAFERLALHFFGEPFVRCSAPVLSNAPEKESHMQTHLSSATPGAPAVLTTAPSEATMLLAAARNAAFSEAAQGRIGEGLSLLHDALQHEPMSHDLMSDMAALLLAAGELEHAAAYAQRALEIRPHHGPSLYSLGFALAGLSEVARAIEVLELLGDGAPLASLQREAPELLPLVQIEIDRLQALQGQTSQAVA